MSSWVVEEKRSWAEWVALRVLKVGPLPRHLALIMDGNRRFAKLHQQNTLHGHFQGFKTLTNVLAWCRDLQIEEVTVYAFSIENFKRSKKEVDGLMSMAVEKFEQLLKEKEKLLKHGVCIRVLGNLELLPLRLRCLAAEAMLVTKDNKSCFLNLAMAYTSREEITCAMKEVAGAVSEGRLEERDVTPRLLEYCLYTTPSSHPPDLLVRTSGETRLSDFLLWQTQFSCIYFTKVLWPELSIWHLFGAVFHYQRHHHMLVEARKQAQLTYDQYDRGNMCCTSHEAVSSAQRIAAFKQRVTDDRGSQLQKLASLLKELQPMENDTQDVKKIEDLPSRCSSDGGAIANNLTCCSA